MAIICLASPSADVDTVSAAFDVQHAPHCPPHAYQCHLFPDHRILLEMRQALYYVSVFGEAYVNTVYQRSSEGKT